MRSRRQKRAEAGLPLFDEPSRTSAGARVARGSGGRARCRPRLPWPQRGRERRRAAASRPRPVLFDEDLEAPAGASASAQSEVELADLPLRAARRRRVPASHAPVESPRRATRTRRPGAIRTCRDRARARDRACAAHAEAPPRSSVRRARASAPRRPRSTPLSSRSCAWWSSTSPGAPPGSASSRSHRPGRGSPPYQGLLALFYAGYFTGTTGQTPGKLMTGLRVVDTSGRPPGYSRAAARAADWASSASRSPASRSCRWPSIRRCGRSTIACSRRASSRADQAPRQPTARSACDSSERYEPRDEDCRLGLARLVATAFGSGYSPFAPGTAGSRVGLLLFWPLAGLAWTGTAGGACARCAVGTSRPRRVARLLGRKDPGLVVVDEVAGQWITLAGAALHA